MGNQKSIDNFIAYRNSLTKEEKRKISQRGAKSAAIKARDKRTTKEIIDIMLDSRISDVEKRREIESYGVLGIRRAELVHNIIQKASKSANMAELLFRLNGELQTEKQQVNVTVVNQLTDEQLELERQRLTGQSQTMLDITPEPPQIEE